MGGVAGDDRSRTRPSPPMGALGERLAEVQRPGQLVGMALGLAIGIGLPLVLLPQMLAGTPGTPEALPAIWFGAIVVVASLLAGAAVTAVVPPFLVSGRDRAASAVQVWIGAREVRRLLGSASAAISIPTEAAAADQWLAAHPDSDDLRPLRFELLVLTGRFDEARSAAERLPRRTPLDEYRVAEARALIDDQESGTTDLLALREAVERVPRGVDRAEAKASLAVFEARRATAGGDWRQPLLAARGEIPESDARILLRDLALPIFVILARRIVLPVAIFVGLVAATLSLLILL